MVHYHRLVSLFDLLNLTINLTYMITLHQSAQQLIWVKFYSFALLFSKTPPQRNQYY